MRKQNVSRVISGQYKSLFFFSPLYKLNPYSRLVILIKYKMKMLRAFGGYRFMGRIVV